VMAAQLAELWSGPCEFFDVLPSLFA
jgi:hypothetical protein